MKCERQGHRLAAILLRQEARLQVAVIDDLHARLEVRGRRINLLARLGHRSALITADDRLERWGRWHRETRRFPGRDVQAEGAVWLPEVGPGDAVHVGGSDGRCAVALDEEQ